MWFRNLRCWEFRDILVVVLVLVFLEFMLGWLESFGFLGLLCARVCVGS